MKEERYFHHELEHMFIVYTIVPAVVSTLVCGLLFMTVLLHGKKSGDIEHSRYTADLLDNMLAWYEDGVEEMASQPGLPDRVRDQDGKAELSGILYDITNSLGLKDDLFVMNSGRNILLSSRNDLPLFLDVLEGVSQGISNDMDREPSRTVLKLAEGWKNGGSTIVIGRSVMDGNKKQDYILYSIPSSRSKALMDKPSIRTIIADLFGWAYVSNNYGLLNNNNQIMKVLMKPSRYLSRKKQMYLISGQRALRGRFTMYSISDIQDIIISLSPDSGPVVTALVLMTLQIFLNSREVTEIKTEDFYKILDVMENARDGDLEGITQTCSGNEFRIIADTYNETIQSLRIQTEDDRKMAELVSVTQNKQLGFQFNPHFLYNTLESIRYMCKLRPTTTKRTVFSLLNPLCYSLDNSKVEVTLKEDLEHPGPYLTILKRRLGERLRCRIDVEPETMDLWIPKLVLQPMIENAVKYGFGKQPNLTVELKAYIHEGKLTTIHRDDGMGILQCTLSELTALLEQEKSPRRHSGLYNTHRRIDILYGHPYGAEIRSVKGHGITLAVTLPMKREGLDGCHVC